MRYIKLKNDELINYTIEQLLLDYPDAVIYKKSKMPNERLLRKYGVYPLTTTTPPDITDDSTVEEGIPEYVNKQWRQTWVIRKLTQEEIDEKVAKSKNTYIENKELENTDAPFIASKETQEQRYEICKECDQFTSLKTCNQCGCIMPLKVKLFSAVCPIGKW